MESFFASVDPRPLCAFRVAFGALMLVHVLRLHLLGMYDRSVVQPRIHFYYEALGVELRPPWGLFPPSSTAGERYHMALIGFSAFGIMIGVFTRTCAATFALGYLMFVLSEKSMFNNHYYLYVLLAGLVSLVGADQAFTVWGLFPRANDAAGAREAAPLKAWQRDLLRFQVCIVYLYAGVAKLNEDWLLHSQPMATKLSDEAAAHGHAAKWLGPLLILPETARAVSIAGVLVDLLLTPLLVVKVSQTPLPDHHRVDDPDR